jgi:hypothetical protein
MALESESLGELDNAILSHGLLLLCARHGEASQLAVQLGDLLAGLLSVLTVALFEPDGSGVPR